MAILCSRCKKRPAVVFITKIEGEKKTNEGLCLVCAKELGIPQVNDIIAKMGLSDEDLEAMSEQYSEIMGDEDPPQTQLTDGSDSAANGNPPGFQPGGSATFPQFLGNIFGGGGQQPGRDGAEAPRKKDRQPQPENKRKFLESFCTNFSKKAREGGFDRIIGRDREIGRMIQILSRRTKNNPCLIGEPGVGKTAIVEGLAQRIVAGNVPFVLRDKEVYLLDLTSLVAGTQFRGQFESRVKSLIDEVRAEGNIILVIDEVHNLAAAGDAADGAMNAANLMKPALSRGEIQVIGATTLKEYRKYIEKDGALERRFQPILIEEPSIEATVRVLSGLKQYYEQYHGVTVEEPLIRTAVELSERYITDRFLPDKAIDLLDEAAACASLRSDALQNYRMYTKLLAGFEARLAALENEEPAKETEEDKDAEVSRYEKIARLQSQILQAKQEIARNEPEAKQAKVTLDDLTKVIELWTGINAAKVAQSDISKLATLEQQLKARVIGQDEAVEALARAIRRSRIRLYETNRPASFIFAGPTGVGKTELVKVLANSLFDTPDSMIRIDMSEYMEKHTVARLIGSPPGYVGYDDAGQLTEKVRRKPYSVVLFDEIEKAHPDIMHVLLQILDDGRVTDAQGRTVDFSNTVIVMTTNAGSEKQGGGIGFEHSVEELAADKVRKALSEFLRPEFLGRVDEVIVFHPLSYETLVKIADLMLSDIRTGLAQQATSFAWSQDVCEKLAGDSRDSRYGARALRTEIRRQVEDRIGDAVIHGDTGGMPAHIRLEMENGEIAVKTE